MPTPPSVSIPTDAPAIAHAMLEEVSAVLQKRNEVTGSGNGNGRWMWTRTVNVVGLIIAIGTIMGVIGQAFYVTRNEYTDTNEKNAVHHETFRQTLESVGNTLKAQTKAMESMTAALQQLQVDVAVLKK